jgi:hypothetical protein
MTMFVPPARSDKPPAGGRRPRPEKAPQFGARGGVEPAAGLHTGTVTEQIVGGAGRTPRRGSRAALVVAAAVLFGYVVTHRYPPPPSPPPPAAPAQPVRASQTEPVLVGRTGPGPAGLRLLVDGTDPRIIDAHTLSVMPVPGLNLRLGSTAQLLQLGRSGIAALATLRGPNGGIYLIRAGAKPLLVAADGVVIPSQDGGLLVAASRRGHTVVTGMTLGRRRRWQWNLPGIVRPLRDTPSGLVVAQYAVSGAAELLVVDRRTGGTVRRLGHGRAVAVSDRFLGWVPVRCAQSCSLVVTRLSTGASRRYDIYRRPVLAAGEFSPDGRQLALSFGGVPGDGGGPQEAGMAAILDLRSGQQAYVPNLTTPPSEHADIAWSTDGQWLVLGVKYPEQERIAVWRPGQDVVILPTVLPRDPSGTTLTTLP